NSPITAVSTPDWQKIKISIKRNDEACHIHLGSGDSMPTGIRVISGMPEPGIRWAILKCLNTAHRAEF
ncbi:hypothetical protein PV327_011107, partial [Microctonus hyperodae]